MNWTDRTEHPDDWTADEFRFAADDAAADAAADANSAAELAFMSSCALCMERPGVVETASGDYICEECYTDRADREYDRLKDLGYDP